MFIYHLHRVIKTGFILFFIFVFFPELISAQGNLLITPRRVVFEGNKKSEELNLANTGSDTAKFVVSLIEYRMKEDGSMEEISIPDSGQNFADKYLRFFPRSVVLAPNEAQVVRVQLTRTNELQPGEYRSHIYFRAVPNEKPLGENSKTADTTSLVVKLTPIFGITIPAIIRVGENNTKVTLSDMTFSNPADTLPLLNVAFSRTGNMSVYGDLTITYISPEGNSTSVGTVKGIAVYTPNRKRTFQINLDKKAHVNYHSGKLMVKFTSQSDSKPVTYAEAELTLH